MVVLFDGYCVLCSGFARWLRHRLGGGVRLEAMQSPEGQRLLTSHGFSPEELNEVVVLADNRVLTGPDAIGFILRRTGGFWGFVGRITGWMPRALVKWGYRMIAVYRYRWFGKRDSCAVI